MMFCLIDVDLHEEYERTEGKAVGFEDRLRLAFGKPNDLLEDWKEILEYKKGNDNATTFIQKVKSMVKKVMSHEVTEEKLTALILVHASENKEIQKEVLMKKLEDVKEIEETIILMEKVEEKTTQVNTVRTYANVSKSNIQHGRRPLQTNGERRNTERRLECRNCNGYGHESRNCRNNKTVECWTCHRKGHISRNCPDKKPLTCFACGKIGHIRRECQLIKCIRCKRNGHKSEECYTKLSRYDTGGRYSQERNKINYKYEERKINAVEDEEDELLDTISNVNEIADEDCGDVYPKERAPLVGETVGARY